MRSPHLVTTTIVGLTLLAALACGQSARMQSSATLALAPMPETSQPPDSARPVDPAAPATCVTADCHADVRQHSYVHGPVGVNACDACHRLVNERDHTFVPAREGLELCTFCHDMSFDSSMVVHEPLTSGQCIACHDPHGGPDRKLLKAPSASALCKQCHEDVIGRKRSVHGPVAAGACAACHSPHVSKYPKLLAAEGPELCTQCHVTTKTQLETLRNVHEPVGRDCQTCHDAHASDHAMMLRDETQSLCLSCHESIKHTVETASTQHAAVTTDRECLNCHEAHASDYPRILQNDMMALCFECHNKEIELPGGKKLSNIKQVIDSGTSLHGPVAQHNCAACHQIHGGEKFRLLVREYPPEFYAPFKEESYALCFSCHDKQLLQSPETTSLTNFRNGDENLHYLHVNRETKGRTCRACHETHASRNPKHIRDEVPFGSGGWKLPVGFKKTEDGGSCAPGCHVSYEYNRLDPVNYTPATEPAIWPADGASPDAPGEAP